MCANILIRIKYASKYNLVKFSDSIFHNKGTCVPQYDHKNIFRLCTCTSYRYLCMYLLIAKCKKRIHKRQINGIRGITLCCFTSET